MKFPRKWNLFISYDNVKNASSKGQTKNSYQEKFLHVLVFFFLGLKTRMLNIWCVLKACVHVIFCDSLIKFVFKLFSSYFFKTKSDFVFPRFIINTMMKLICIIMSIVVPATSILEFDRVGHLPLWIAETGPSKTSSLTREQDVKFPPWLENRT